jgi:tetratricopeptide (TPR) repeat protein
MEREHTLQWLDHESDDRTGQVLSQVRQEWDGHHYPEAIHLCEHLIERAEELQQHLGQGLAYCYLGETYRLMGVQHHQDAVEAFGRARVHFSLDGTAASNRNKSIAYWSLAMVLEQLPARWNDALRYYQSALDTIQRELEEVQSQSASPRNDRARLARQLTDIQHLVREDQANLLRQQTMGDSKLVGLVRELAATEHRLGEAEERIKELVERAEKAAIVATKATEQAYYAARAAQAVRTASDSTSRQALHAARHIDQLIKLMDRSMQRLQGAVDRIEAATGATAIAPDSPPLAPASPVPGRRRKKEA